MSKLSVCVLIPSCGRYSDIWHPFATLFGRHWPDCPYPVYLSTGQRDGVPGFASPIPVGDDRDWSGSLKTALSQIREDYVLLFLDDLLLHDRVDTDVVRRHIDTLASVNGNFLSLSGTPPPDRPFISDFGYVSEGAIYRTSTVTSVWRKDVLSVLLANGETAWQFELQGSIRSDAFGHFFSTTRRVLPVVNALVRGTWTPAGLQLLNKAGISPSSSRPAMNRLGALAHRLKLARHRLLMQAPASKRRAVRAFFLT
jgi:hypothetical protein